MEWLASHAPAPPEPSLAQVVCMAKVPVDTDRSNEPPLMPGVIQAHLSPFSEPLESVQPPGGFWAGRLAGRRDALVHPYPGVGAAGRIGDVRGVAGRAALGAGGRAVAVLSHHARPQLAARPVALHELLNVGSLPGGVARQGHVAAAIGALSPPLGSVEDQVDLLVAGSHADPVDTAAIVKIVGRGLAVAS